MATYAEPPKAIARTAPASPRPTTPPSLLTPLLLAEAHHRIANSLQVIATLVRLQAAGITKQKRDMSARDVEGVLEEAAGRIGTVALLHRLLSKSPQQEVIDLGIYLRDVCDNLAAALSSGGQVEVSCPDAGICYVPADQAAPLAILISELVTNATKYAHPSGVAGRIAISCRRAEDGSLRLEISDDGVGMPEGFDPTVDGGLGLTVVRALAQQLGATLSFDSTDVGLTVRLHIPTVLQ